MVTSTETTMPPNSQWLTDANGNRASVEYFGTVEAAQAALDSLKNCDNCTNCSGCSGCSRCSRCSDCAGCSDCSRCSRCSDCSGCSRCSDCSRCSRCSDCSDCSGCSRCSDCSGCSHIALLDGKTGLIAEPSEATATLGAPAVPRIENIHQKVYAAVTQPNAFDMANWHTCGTTHCRGGWVVTLAGAEGKALEDFHNPELAAM